MSEGAAYLDLLREEPTVKATLTAEELEGCFTLEYYMKNVDFIYKRNKIEE